MKTWTVPGDQPTLAEALEAASDGDVIALEGHHTVGMTIVTKALTIQGGQLSGTGPAVLRLEADATLRGIRIENAQHGVVVKEGSPRLEDLEMSVGGTAIACGWSVKPQIRGVRIQKSSIGLSAQADAAPYAEDLVVTSTGSGLFFCGNAKGTITSCAIAAGQMAAVEVAENAAPTLVSVSVAAAGRGGFFIHGTSKPQLHGCSALRCGLAGMEVTGDADPTVDGFLVREGGAGGLFLHGSSKGTYLELHIDGGPLAAIEISEQATPELERGLIAGTSAGGVWVHGEAKVELVDFNIKDCRFQALEIADSAEVRAENCTLTKSGSHGVLLRDKARLGLVGSTIEAGYDCGMLGQDAAMATVEGGRIAENRSFAVKSEGGAVFVLDPLVEVVGKTDASGHGAIHRVGEA